MLSRSLPPGTSLAITRGRDTLTIARPPREGPGRSPIILSGPPSFVVDGIPLGRPQRYETLRGTEIAVDHGDSTLFVGIALAGKDWRKIGIAADETWTIDRPKAKERTVA